MDSIQRLTLIFFTLAIIASTLCTSHLSYASGSDCASVLSVCNGQYGSAGGCYQGALQSNNPSFNAGIWTNNFGYYQDCQASPPCVSGSTISSGYYDIGTSPDGKVQSSGCDNSCGSNFQGTSPAARKLVNGIYHYYAQGSYVTNSFSCTSGTTSTGTVSPTGSTTTAPDTCPTGQTLGQVNGVNLCLASGTPTNPNAPPTTTKIPDTKTSTTDPTTGVNTTTTTTQNGDGTQTTTTTTTNPDGSSTTVANTTNPDGTPTDPLKGFCQANPTSPICSGQNPFCKDNPDATICKKSSISASCGGFTCDGDAVQCEIAQEQYTKNCQLFTTTTTQSDLGNAVAGGADPQNATIQSMLNPTATDLSTAFQSAQGSRWLSSADLPPINMAVMGRNFTMDTSNISMFLRYIGYILVAGASIVAIRMVAN